MNQAIYECSCQNCGRVWSTTQQGLQRPCPKCSSSNFLYQEVTKANLRAAMRLEKPSRWPLRIDIMIGVLLAGLVWLLLSAIAGVGFWLLAADAVEDNLNDEDVPTEDITTDMSVTCPGGRIFDPNTNSCS